MVISVTLLYALLLGGLGLILQFLVSVRRGQANISLESGGDPALTEAIRRHANWIETVPIALLVMLLLELNDTPKTWLHGLGAVLLGARILHPFGLDAANLMRPLRFAGMGGTILATLGLFGIGAWQLLVR